MKTFRNSHKGETCILIGNGPSLADVPLDFLNKYPSFACNYISLKDGFVPTFLTVADPLAITGEEGEENPEWRIEAINKSIHLVENAFIIHTEAHRFPFDNVRPIYNVKAACFSYCPVRYLFTGGTSMFVNMQLAFLFGFTEALIVGMDHDYSGDKHFHPDYKTTHQTREGDGIAQLSTMEKSYHLAQRAWQVADRRLLNASHYSKCGIFPRLRPPWLLDPLMAKKENKKSKKKKRKRRKR